MNTIALIFLALFILAILITYRLHRVLDFRNKWRTELQHSPEGIAAFHNMVPGFNAMFFKFWKPMRDRYWIPTAMLVEKSLSELNDETREAVNEWVKKGGKV